MNDHRTPTLPYAGTSGWSGSETSKVRAITADLCGVTGARQRTVLDLADHLGLFGVTWKELADATGWHHGTASGALSVLHKDGHLARLAESRNRCRVYVTPEYVAGRPTESHGRKPHTCPNCGWSE